MKMRKRGYMVRYADEPFRYCIFPHNPVNAMHFCENQFATHKVNESHRCKQTMCTNCCNLMEENLKFISQTYGMGKILSLENDGQWFMRANPLFTREYIEQCRAACL